MLIFSFFYIFIIHILNMKQHCFEFVSLFYWFCLTIVFKINVQNYINKKERKNVENSHITMHNLLIKQ